MTVKEPPWPRLRKMGENNWLDKMLARLAYVLLYDWSTYLE